MITIITTSTFKEHQATKVAKVSDFKLMEKFAKLSIMKMVNCAFRAVWQSCNVFLVFAMFSEHCSTLFHHNVLSFCIVFLLFGMFSEDCSTLFPCPHRENRFMTAPPSPYQRFMLDLVTSSYHYLISAK